MSFLKLIWMQSRNCDSITNISVSSAGYLCESSFTEGDSANGVLHKDSNGDLSADSKMSPSTVCPFCFMDLKAPDLLRA